MSEVGEVLLGVFVGYLIGTFPSADLVTRAVTRGSVDIRQEGSGNPGGLNTMRVLGKGWGGLVMFLDALKGAVAGFAGLAIGDAAAYAAGTAAIAGHVWPAWTRFRGGRGVATAGGSFASVFPPFLPIAVVFALVVTLIRRNPALTIVLVCPLWIAAAAVWWGADLSNWWGPEPEAGLLVYAMLGALMVLARFRSSVRSGSGFE
ncbi:MAG: glycerol-3-phosphate acyltransferase [Acidimicrobiia bacterium]